MINIKNFVTEMMTYYEKNLEKISSKGFKMTETKSKYLKQVILH